MHPSIQSALDAINQGDKSKAVALVKQVLETNPNDLDALLTLATLVDESTHKRKVLNRVLSLEPINKTAREMLLEMDRAEMGVYLSKSTTPQSQPGVSISQQNIPSQKPVNTSLEKPLVFHFSTAWLVVLYGFTTLACCATLWFASMNVANSLAFLAMAIVLGLGALTASSKVELDETGIHTSSLIGSDEMRWDEIESIKLNPLKRNLELTSNIGESVAISTQIKGYNVIKELLRQKRPDLFPQAVSTPAAAIPVPESQPSALNSFSKSASESAAAPQPTARIPSSEVPAPEPISEKPLVFRPSSVWMILFYVFMTISCCTGILVASQNISSSLPSFGLALLFGLTALSNTSKVEVRDTGIRASALFGSTEIKWDEISGMKSNSFRRKLELISNNGKSVNISTQVKGYPVLVDILREKRPDLFTETISSPAIKSISSTGIEQSPSTGQDTSVSTPELTGIKTFQKSFLKQYGMFLWVTPVCLLMAWFGVTVTDSQLRLASFISVAFCALVLLIPFFQVSGIKVESNKLTIETFFQEKELSAQEIREIKMQSLQGRYGRVTNIVNIIPVEGKNYPLGGFADGEEIIYGYLMNWWNTYQNR